MEVSNGLYPNSKVNVNVDVTAEMKKFQILLQFLVQKHKKVCKLFQPVSTS